MKSEGFNPRFFFPSRDGFRRSRARPTGMCDSLRKGRRRIGYPCTRWQIVCLRASRRSQAQSQLPSCGPYRPDGRSRRVRVVKRRGERDDDLERCDCQVRTFRRSRRCNQNLRKAQKSVSGVAEGRAHCLQLFRAAHHNEGIASIENHAGQGVESEGVPLFDRKHQDTGLRKDVAGTEWFVDIS